MAKRKRSASSCSDDADTPPHAPHAPHGNETSPPAPSKTFFPLSPDSSASLWKTNSDAYEAFLSDAYKEGKCREIDDRVRVVLRKDVIKRGRRLALGDVKAVVEWKLMIGKWRPRLATLAASNTSEAVEEVSAEVNSSMTQGRSDDDAVDEMPDVSHRISALRSLTRLKGVGPATASALLALAYPESSPFMSDPLLAVMLKGNSISGWSYKEEEYIQVLNAVDSLLARLRKEDPSTLWTAERIEKGAFVAVHTFLNESTAASTQSKANAKRRK